MNSSSIVGLLWGVSVTSFVYAWIEWRRVQQLRQRMERMNVTATGVATLSATLTARELAELLGARLHALLPRLGRSRRTLADAAGIRWMTTEEMIGWQIVAAGTGALIGLVLTAGFGFIGLAFIIVLPLVGWVVFEVWLRRRAASRIRAIQRSLLTVMDLLSLSLDAGMGLDRAIRLICERVNSPLVDELRLVLTEIDLGVSRRDAFSHLAERVALEEIRSLTMAIVQAEELSMSLVESMRIQARSVRVQRRQDSEAEAQRAPVKMLFPMVIFVLPALFIIILAPAAMQLMKVLSF